MSIKQTAMLIAALVTGGLAMASSAEAGGCGGYYNSFRSSYQGVSQRRQSFAAKQRRDVLAARRSAAKAKGAAEVAEAPKTETTTTADTATATTEAKSEKKVAAAAPVCTRFVPAIGTTVTVDCPR